MTRRNGWHILLLAATIACGILIAACSAGSTPAPALEPITLQLDWTHSAQFAGFYVADTKGYYADQGLTVSFRERPASRTEQAALQKRVARGEVDFGLAGVALLNAQVDGSPLVALAAILQVNPQVFIARADSGINGPQDFAGRRLGIKNEAWGQVFTRTLRNVGLSISDTIPVPVGYDMQPFYDGAVDVWPGYVTDEPVRARHHGLAISLFFPYDYGVGGYGEIIYTSRDMVVQRPDLVERFLRASLQGWQDTLEHPNDAVDILVTHYAQAGDREFEQQAVHALLPLVYTGEYPLGWITPEGWAATYQGDSQAVSPALRETGLDTRFLTRIVEESVP